MSTDILKSYVGTYDFGASLSSRDKQAPILALAFAGTGLEVAAMDDKVTVRRPIEGGPAEKAGVKAGDLITEIDDVTTKGLTIGQVLDKLRGRPGTSVKLELVRKDQQSPIDVTIVREPIRLPGARIQVRRRGRQARRGRNGTMVGPRLREGQAGSSASDVEHGVLRRGWRSRTSCIREGSDRQGHRRRAQPGALGNPGDENKLGSGQKAQALSSAAEAGGIP